MKDKVRKIIDKVLYTNLKYPVCGNRYLLASNLLFNEIGVTDIDMIYELAKIMENQAEFELNDNDFEFIYVKFVQLAKDYQSKEFDNLLNLKTDGKS